MPTALRTKDKLAFARACTLLHEATGEARYLDSAIQYADAVCDRQCVDPARADDGLGFFYEFDGDNDAFMIEFCHNHKFYMGNIEPTNLSPLMYLVHTLPASERTARYLRTIRLYADAYVKHSATLTPLSIYPQSVYSGEQRGVHFFSVAVHGFTCLYGQIAKNLLELAAFLGDEKLARLAERNLLFPVGRNPGFGDAYTPTRWECMSLIKGVGSRSFGGVHALEAVPDGSAMNGFAAHQLDVERRLADQLDEPLGIWKEEGVKWFNEDYLPHSHGYVSGVAQREKPYTLSLQVTDQGEPVCGEATVTWSDGEKQTLALGVDGKASLITDRMYRYGSITMERLTRERSVVALPGGHDCLCIALDKQVCVTLTKAGISVEGEVSLKLTMANEGPCAAAGVIRLMASGIELHKDAYAYDLQPGASVEAEVSGKAANAMWLIAQRRPEAAAVLLTGFASE